MSQTPPPEPPRIEFPCAYPIKVMGVACDEFRDHVIEVMGRHDESFDRHEIKIRDSRNGRFQALTVVITARGEDHLRAIFEDLKESSHVQMVL